MNTYVEVNRHRTGKTSHHIDHHLKVGNHRASPIRIGYTWWKSRILILMSYESIQIDSSAVNPARDEAFAKVQVELPDIHHPKSMLKMKVDTGAQGNLLSLRIYRNMFLEHVDDNGLPTGTKLTQTKLTAYNGTPIMQHGVCSIKCSYGGKETNARFYAADVNGPAKCGSPTSCELQLLELHCATSTTQILNPTIRDKSDLQLLYPDRFNGIGKLEGEYHIVTDPDVPPLVHAPRKCPNHIADDIKKELDEMVSLGVIQLVTEPTD